MNSEIITINVYDSINKINLCFKAKTTCLISVVLIVFCHEREQKYKGYKYEDREIDDFSLSLGEIGIKNNGVITAY